MAVKQILDLNLDEFRAKDANSFQIKKISQRDIAIIGMSCRMPLADDPDKFWQNNRSSKDCLRPIPESRRADLDAYLRYLNPEFQGANYQEGAYIDDIDKFDYPFFDLSPKEAELTDPNQRLFLETAWGAMEDAGYGGKRLQGSMTGVYIGSEGGSEYKRFITELEPTSLSIALPGNVPSIIAARISYLLDLKGPCLMVDTACSSALVAVHLACKAIRAGECDQAIAGGIRIYLLPFRQAEIGVESSDGRTKTFDHYSDGLGAGEGVIAVLLKPLSRAVKEHDHIYAVIKGSAVNQDGRSIGITAPNAAAQEEVIVSAWKDAEIDPNTISYIEAHGSGTTLGDPVEINGITRAFTRFTNNKQFCAVSSVKTNIGHLDTAAGIAGLLRAVLAIKYRELPPTLYFNRPNQKIPFADSPVYVNDELTQWIEAESALRCGISSFGISGTNCHVVIESPPPPETTINETGRAPHILALSARDEAALKRLVGRYQSFLGKAPEIKIGALCYTANTGRGTYRYRLALVVKDIQDLIGKIARLNSNWNEAILEDGIFYGWGAKNSEKEVAELNGSLPKKRVSFPAGPVGTNGNLENENSETEKVKRICELYIGGAEIDWNSLYPEGVYHKLSLPTYPFERKRCWLSVPESDDRNCASESDLFYATGWEKSVLGPLAENTESGYTLVLKGKTHQAQELVLELKKQGFKVIEVTCGNRFEQINDLEYIINGTEADYEQLLAGLGNRKEQLTRIIHTFTLTEECDENSLEAFKAQKELGVHQLFRLAKGLLKIGVRTPIDLVLIAGYVHEITGNEERIEPSGALMFGFGKTIGWENPNLNCRCLDIDHSTGVAALVNEIRSGGSDYKVAYRQNERLVEVLQKIDLAQVAPSQVRIKENGVYVIIGGMGRIGLIVAKHLASKNPVNLFLINRSPLPDREEWNQIIASATGAGLSAKLKQIREIEAMGSPVHFYSADITNESEIGKVFAEIRKNFGPIHGVIHSAGVGIGSEAITIENESEEIFRQVMAPKVEGTWNLNRITRQDKLDFFLLFSSAITLIGGVGGGDYTAANTYQDSFAAFGRRGGKYIKTIAWPVWKESGPAYVVKHAPEKQVFKIISPGQAMAAFDRVLAKDLNNVIVGDFNYQSKVFELGNLLPFRLSRPLKETIDQNQAPKPGKSGKLKEPIRLMGKAGADYTNIENLIAGIWREVLGYDEFNVNDNFFEIGGDSIRIKKMQGMLNEHFPGKVSIPDLFSYPTIYQLAKYISSVVEKGTENLQGITLKMKITELLRQVKTGQMSLEQAIVNYSALGKDNE